MKGSMLSVSVMLGVFLVACSSENQSFCSRYQYLYDQLQEEEDLPTYGEMRQKLTDEINDPSKDKDQSQFMLFVLEDWHSGRKPSQETAKDYCLRTERWKAYP
jgi:hypothetical protein